MIGELLQTYPHRSRLRTSRAVPEKVKQNIFSVHSAEEVGGTLLFRSPWLCGGELCLPAAFAQQETLPFTCAVDLEVKGMMFCRSFSETAFFYLKNPLAAQPCCSPAVPHASTLGKFLALNLEPRACLSVTDNYHRFGLCSQCLVNNEITVEPYSQYIEEWKRGPYEAVPMTKCLYGYL
ncbi:hypothetical protein T12_4582 [Trichinella patagoniensis]|uniref:Uncharacterized protein n=1 Tax=Trichinella patagoniensis TaxID=990121 RepID=A0A0V0ZJZ9_9BILA|nr:hypothetical protein T12_4582 [Trichinella patagoniensis]